MEIKINPGKDVTVVSLLGDIDEVTPPMLGRLHTLVESSKLIFDCAGVRRINSFGARSWALILAGFVSKFEISFIRCPQAFLDMAIMVPAFTHKRPILSFYTAFRCTDCSRESLQLIEMRGKKGIVPERPVCPRCGGALMPGESLADDIAFVADSSGAA